MTVSTYQQTSLGVQAQSVDGDLSVLSRLGAAFAPHAQATPDMTVALDAGHVFDGATLTEVAAQSASLTAPAANPRIDRIVVNQLTGIVSVVTGTEAASPAVPAIPSGFAPVAQVRLSAGATAITNDMITDERDLSALGRIIAVEAGAGLTGGGSSGTVIIGLETPVAVALGGTGTATAAAGTVFAGPASGSDAAPSFRSLTLADLPADVATTEELSADVATLNETITTLGQTVATEIGQAIVIAAPPGAVQHFAMSIAPNGWLAADGRAVSRTTYAALFAAIGTRFGAGDGSTTFVLPDLRGEFVRGWDNGRGLDAGRVFCSTQGDQFGDHLHRVTDGLVQNYEVEFATPGTTNIFAPVTGSGAFSDNYSYTIYPLNGNHGSETRPTNVALLACIKY